jgi:hypothetical protein
VTRAGSVGAVPALRVVALLAALFLGMTASATGQTPGPAGRTYACWQTVERASRSGYDRIPRGVLHLYATEVAVYELSGERSFLPQRSARTGRWAWDGSGLRFTSGPYHVPDAGWDLAGTYHPDGVPMPHDRRHGRRYQVVLRSVLRHPAKDAPPRRVQRDPFVTPWYCRALQ